MPNLVFFPYATYDFCFLNIFHFAVSWKINTFIAT